MHQKVRSYFNTLTERWAVVPFLGFGFYCAWIWLSFNSTAVVSAHPEGTQAFMVLLTYIVSTATIGCFSCIWGAAYKLTVRLVSSPGIVLVFGILAGISTSVAGYASALFSGLEPVILAVYAAVSGFGTSLLLMRFGFLCTHVGLRSSLANASGAALVGVSLYFIVIAMPPGVAIAMTALLPVGAAFLLMLPEYDPFPAGELADGARTVDRRTAHHEFNKLITAAVVMSFFGGLGKGLSVFEFSNQLFSFSGVVTAFMVGAIAIVILAAIGGTTGKNLAGKLYLGIMLLTILVLFLACFDIGITYINGCKEALWILFSCLFAYAVFRFDFKPVRCFAFGQAAWLLTSALGWAAGAFVALQHFPLEMRVATSIVIMLAFLLVLLFVFRPEDVEAMTDSALLVGEDAAPGQASAEGNNDGAAVVDAGAGTAQTPTPSEPAPAEPAQASALTPGLFIDPEFGLSAREMEITLLYAQGRSANWIADELVISSNTVHTHLRNAYVKLDVHNRQQLRNLLEQG